MTRASELLREIDERFPQFGRNTNARYDDVLRAKGFQPMPGADGEWEHPETRDRVSVDPNGNCLHRPRGSAGRMCSSPEDLRRDLESGE